MKNAWRKLANVVLRRGRLQKESFDPRPPYLRPGGVYPGIVFIPGYDNKEWAQGAPCGVCPACFKGTLVTYWQGKYYRVYCDACRYMDDAGMRLN